MPSPYESIPESRWEVYEVTEDYIRSRCDLGEMYVYRTQYLEDATLLKLNKHEYDESEGKRWGDGKVVARVPLNKFFSELAEGVRQGDRDHIKWWLNNPDNIGFRTFKGKI